MKYLLTAGIMIATTSTPIQADTSHLSQERKHELIRLVRQDCGSCHGMKLTGGLGPALTPQALKDKPAAALISTILQGRPGTPMPPWNNFISESEAGWIVDSLQTGFPDAR